MATVPGSDDRREFLRVCVVGGALAVGAGLGAWSLSRPAWAPGAASAPVPLAPMLRANALPLHEPVALDVSLARREGWRVRNTRRHVLIVRTGEESFQAFSPVCPHKGCSVQADTKEKRFACPCHDAQFDLSGAVTSGPAPRGLDPLELQVAEHEGAPWLFVTWQEFLTGTPERTGRQA